MLPRSLDSRKILLVIAALSLGCASGPAIITNTPDNIAVEFPSDGTVKDASVLAQKACEGHGKVAEFGSVDATASPKTRIAKFKCVSASGSEGSEGSASDQE